MNSVRRVLIAVIVCLLVSAPAPVSGAINLTVSISPQDYQVEHSGGTWVSLPDAESIAQPGQPALPVLIRYFRITQGTLTDVAIEKSEPILLTERANPVNTDQLTTFSGNDLVPASYYSESLKREAAKEAFLNVRPLLTQQMTEEGMIAVVAAEPVSYDPETMSLYGYSRLDFEFVGSADLRIEKAPLASISTRLEPVQPMLSNNPGRSSSPASQPFAEYIIVTADEFIEPLTPLAHWKHLHGKTTAIVSIESVISGYSGVDDAEKLRNYLIESYNSGTKYVLLAGDKNILPIRYAYHGNVSEHPDLDLQQLCDLYFADVDGNWDADEDGVYGEPGDDAPDLTPELLLGRLPFSTHEQFDAYVEKLIKYEMNPGDGEYEWLNRSLFVSADQMRDYQQIGQHELVGSVLPPHVSTDMIGLVEAPSGAAENPDAPYASDALALMNEGWGTTSLLIHGMHDGWVIRSSSYNEWPKSFLLTSEGSDGAHGHLPNLSSNGKPGLVYSIGCNNAAFDMDQPPFPATTKSVVESFLEMPNGGAVAFIGYSRWGWVASCWKIEKAFMEFLYDSVETNQSNICEALRQAKAQFPYYRDMIYGLNYFGDPTLRMWTNLPLDLQVEHEPFSDTGMVTITLQVNSGDSPLEGAIVTVMRNDSTIVSTMSDREGTGVIEIDYNVTDTFEVFVRKDGHIAALLVLSPEIQLDADDELTTLPVDFSLNQNFPNPFNPTTTIAFSTRTTGSATLRLYNILGQEVATLVDEILTPGTHDVSWDGRDRFGRMVASGVYFAHLRQGHESAVIKMTLLK